MSITQQHALDSHRLGRTGQAPPPVPGSKEGALLLGLLARLRRNAPRERRARTARAG